MREGSVVEESSDAQCVCRTGWSGRRCGVPATLRMARWLHDPKLTKALQLRRRVKRVIMLVPLMHEYEIFEANVNALHDIVDVFVVGERSSNLSEHATLPLLDRLKTGWLGDHQDKFVYVAMHGDAPHNASLIQTLVHDGLRLLSDIRPDDLLVLTTGEEIVNRDVLVFLKLFQGYPLPIRCQFSQFLFGYFWRVERSSRSTPEICILSIKFFANAFEYQTAALADGRIASDTQAFLTTKDQPLQDWALPEVGWRCHLCLEVPTLFEKFAGLPQSSRPRWFSDSPGEMLPFLQRLIKAGQDEDLNQVGSVNVPKEEFLPPFVWENRDRFAHLMANPYETMSLRNVV